MSHAARVAGHGVLVVVLSSWAVHARWMRRDEPARRWLWISMVWLAVGEALHLPVLYTAVEHLLGPGWGTVARHVTGIVASTGVLLVIDHTVAHGSRTRRVHAVAGVVAGVVAVLPWLVAAPAAVPATLRDQPVYYDGTARSGVHWAAYLVLLGWALGGGSWLCWRTAAAIPQPRARTGARLVGAGTGVGVVYVVWHAVVTVVWLTGNGPAWVGYDTVGDTLTLGPALILIVVGSAWERMAARGDDVVARRDVRLLRGRWERLTAVLPEVSPWPGAVARPAGGGEQLHWQRARLATEIHDAVRALSGLVPEAVQDRVAAEVAGHGLRGTAASAAVEEVCLVLATAAHRAGGTATGTGREPRLHADDSAAAARVIARRVRAARRPRVRRVVAAVLDPASAVLDRAVLDPVALDPGAGRPTGSPTAPLAVPVGLAVPADRRGPSDRGVVPPDLSVPVDLVEEPRADRRPPTAGNAPDAVT